MVTDDGNRWDGIKLKNPPGTNLCYLNAALNCMGNSSTLRSLIYKECLSGLEDLSNKRILSEVNDLFRLQGRIGDASELRELLHEKFNRFEAGEQKDAANAFLSILECLIGAKEHCGLELRVKTTCLECGFEKSRIDSNQWGILLGDSSTVGKTLQEAVNEWVSRVSTVEFACVCKERDPLESVQQAEESYTNHREQLEILKFPEILHIKVKDRGVRTSTIKMTDKFMLSGNEYILNTGMLYEGSGNCGHWRCIARVGESLVILNDEQSPVQGSIQDLRLGTDFFFCKVDRDMAMTSNHIDHWDSGISSNYS